MKRFLLLLAPLVVACLPLRAQEEARTALIVGVETYGDRYFSPLGAPVADAKALQAKLHALGFQAELVLNPTRRQLTVAPSDR